MCWCTSRGSVLICKPNEKQNVSGLFLSTPAPVTSCLDVERRKERGKSGDVPIRRALLEVITSGAAANQVQIETYVRSALLFAETKKAKPPQIDPQSFSGRLVSTTIEYLVTNEFISVRNSPQPASKDAACTKQWRALCVQEKEGSTCLVLLRLSQNSVYHY